jgi:hypothetical protein
MQATANDRRLTIASPCLQTTLQLAMLHAMHVMANCGKCGKIQAGGRVAENHFHLPSLL